MNNLRNYSLVTGVYWGFTLTDGALRMLVLLHFYQLGYSPIQIALLFLLYEFFGIITNLVGGWLGSHFGLKITLFAGLALQIIALTSLAMLNPTWSASLSMAYVMGAQALSGIAKDLTKMSSKSAIKVLIPEEAESTLFKWVAILTGLTRKEVKNVIDRAIQVHGALGMTDDTILSFWFRHERAARIYDGADEVHKSSVAKRILKKYRK